MKKNKQVIIATISVLACLSIALILLCVGLKESKAQEGTGPKESASISESVSFETKQEVKEAEISVAKAEEEVKETENMTTGSGTSVAEAKQEVTGSAAVSAEEEKTETTVSVSASTEEVTSATTTAASETSTSEIKQEVKEPEPEPAPEPEPEPAPEPELQDLKPPMFIYYSGAPQLKVGSTFNVHKYIGYIDDVDRNVDLRVDGSVDSNTIGTYPLTLTLTDDAGRTTVKNMEVHIVEEVTSSGGSGMPKEQFSDFIANFKTEDNLLGIDVSRWQMDIDYDKIKEAGCEFVYMRVGGFDSGDFFIDKSYRDNIAGAKRVGLLKGIYWYGEESGPEEIKASVKYLMDILDGEPLDFPIAYDWEDFRNIEYHGMNLYDLNMLFEYFEQEVEKYGYKACLYGSKNKQETIWTREKKNAVWLAHYNIATSYAGPYFMWQRSNTGRINGIKGDVDLDILFPDRLAAIMNE